MKATGIVRRIDDLGRVVVPKEIRRTLRIREGDPLEIFTDREGEIVLKKYSPIGELSALAGNYVQSLSQSLHCTAAICDMDQIVAVAGGGKKELDEQLISKELEEILLKRKKLLAFQEESSYINVVDVEESAFTGEAICPILCEGDVIGGVLLLGEKNRKKLTDLEMQVAVCVADFFGRQMEQ